MYCFATAFKKRKPSASQTMSPSVYEDNLFTFDVILEFKEEDGKGERGSGNHHIPSSNGSLDIALSNVHT